MPTYSLSVLWDPSPFWFNDWRWCVTHRLMCLNTWHLDDNVVLRSCGLFSKCSLTRKSGHCVYSLPCHLLACCFQVQNRNLKLLHWQPRSAPTVPSLLWWAEVPSNQEPLLLRDLSIAVRKVTNILQLICKEKCESENLLKVKLGPVSIEHH